jgi:hypothetical protein
MSCSRLAYTKEMIKNMLVEKANHIPIKLVQQNDTLKTTIKILAMEPNNTVKQILYHFLEWSKYKKKYNLLASSSSNTVPKYGPLWHLDMRSSLMRSRSIQKENTVSAIIQQEHIETLQTTIQTQQTHIAI